MQWRNITSKTIHQMIRMDKDTTVDDMSTGMTTDVRVMENEVDSLGIATYNRVVPPSASHATKKAIGMQTVHRRTKLILNSVHTVE